MSFVFIFRQRRPRNWCYVWSVVHAKRERRFQSNEQNILNWEETKRGKVKCFNFKIFFHLLFEKDKSHTTVDIGGRMLVNFEDFTV